MSFTTLMTLGYADLTPIGPPSYTLTWLEVMSGQFSMAVVVAQLVGLKLAQALRGNRPDSK
jgi:voltage-gated potassium channel